MGRIAASACAWLGVAACGGSVSPSDAEPNAGPAQVMGAPPPVVVTKPEGARPPGFPAPQAGTAMLDVTLHNLSTSPCEYTFMARRGSPAGNAPIATIAPGDALKLSMSAREALTQRMDDGSFGGGAAVDASGGEIVLTVGCRFIVASDARFSSAHLAWMSAHPVVSCCGSCQGTSCEGCSELKSGMKCPEQLPHAGRCALYEDVLDCAPAASVDAGGYRDLFKDRFRSRGGG